MRVLITNWRDLSHPLAGGAEVFTEEVGKRLVALGNEITIFTSAFDGSYGETFRSGMRILRKGGKYSVYSEARDYVKKHMAEFDIIVDEINTVPFQIPKIARNKPVVALIHQLAREIWFYETRFPINALGYFVLEPLWLRMYRQIPTVTVSDSTKVDLESRGFQRVHTIYNGIGTRPLVKLPKKAPNPVLVFVGRLVRSKHPDHAISAFRRVRKRIPNVELWILGDGYMRRKLEGLAERGVKFFGRVSDQQKFELLKRSHVLLVPSVREGWGVSVIEANAMGTSAVGYSVPGLRDSIINGFTGHLVKPADFNAMAEIALDILLHPGAREWLAQNALGWSRKFEWDTSAERFQSILDQCTSMGMCKS